MSTRHLLAGLAACLLTAAYCLGQETAKAPRVSRADEDIDLALTKLRDPFWPVGWEPPPTEPVKGKTVQKADLIKWDEARKSIHVTGLSKDSRGKFIAIIKGIGVVEPGDTISVRHSGLVYKWKVSDITTKGIVPEQIGVYPGR
jgi:hypothetical protein